MTNSWTCPKCGKRIPNRSTYCHCAACHETFTGIVAFDEHRRGFACLDPATIIPRPNGDTFSRDHLGHWHFGEAKTAAEWEAAEQRRSDLAREQLRAEDEPTSSQVNI